MELMSDRRHTFQAVHPLVEGVGMMATEEWENHIQNKTSHKGQMVWVLDSRCILKNLSAAESC